MELDCSGDAIDLLSHCFMFFYICFCIELMNNTNNQLFKLYQYIP